MAEIVLPLSGSGVSTYTSMAAFPTDAEDGALAIALDTDKLYVYDLSTTTWILVGPANVVVAYVVNKITLSSTDITNKVVTLTRIPSYPALTVMSVTGGLVQDYGTDYTIVNDQLSWSGLFLDGVLVAGDILTVQFY